MFSVLLVLSLLYVGAILGCSPPLGWMQKTLPALIEDPDLSIAITGMITSLQTFNSTDKDMTIMKYTIKMECVVRNKNQVNIATAGEITVTRVGGRFFHSCELFYNYLRFNEIAVILLKPLSTIPGEFEFQQVNYQGPVFYTTEDFNATSACTTLSSSSSVQPEQFLWLAVAILVCLLH